MSSEASKEVKTKDDKSDEKNVETSAIAASATTESGAKTDDVQPVAVDDKVAPVEGAADVVPPEKDIDDQVCCQSWHFINMVFFNGIFHDKFLPWQFSIFIGWFIIVIVVQDDDAEGEDDHEDPLVIDEAEERSEGADSDEKVHLLS